MKKFVFIACVVSSSAAVADYEYQIGESTDSLTRLIKVNPASLQFVNPDVGESDYDIRIGHKGAWTEEDAGAFAGYDYDFSRTINFDVIRDTLTDKPQNFYKMGFGIDYYGIREAAAQGANAVFFNLGGDLKYTKDEQKDIESYIVGTDFLPFNLFFADRLRSVFRANPDRAKFYQLMTFNLAYEKVIHAPLQANGMPGEGANSRFWINETFKFYPFFSRHGERIELAYSAEYGNDLSSSGLYSKTDDTWVFNEVALNYYLNCEQTVSIGWSYTNGELRRENKPDDKQATVALRVSWPPKAAALKTCG